MTARLQVSCFLTHAHNNEDDKGDGRTGIWIGGDEDGSLTSIAAIRWSLKLNLGAVITIIRTLSQIKVSNFMNLERF